MRTAINVLLEREALTDKVDVELFGASENSVVVLAGLMLAGTDREKKEQRREVLGRLFEFRLSTFPQKGAPEHNHKHWFEAIDPAIVSVEESAEYLKLRQFSMSINGLADWHDYYDRLNHLARKTNIEHTILSYISKYSPEWDNYISLVRQEIIDRAAELE